MKKGHRSNGRRPFSILYINTSTYYDECTYPQVTNKMTFSITQKSQLEGAHRLDAEYYQPEYLLNGKALANYGYDVLQSFSSISITKGETPLWRGDDYLNKGIPFLRSENLTPLGLDISSIVFISNKVHERMKRSHILPGDILVAIVGATIGQNGLVTDDYSEYNSNQAIAIIRPSRKELSAYLGIVLETKYCQLQIERLKGGGARDNLDLHEVQVIKIPKPSAGILEYCKAALLEITSLKKITQSLYSQAENLLLEELGLKDKKFDEDLTTVVKFSDIKKAERMDADYFQPKYEKLISKIKSQKSKLLGDIATIKKGIEPGAEAYQDEGKLFIRVSSLSKQGITDKDEKYLNEKLYETLKQNYQPRVGEVLLTKDASPGVAYALKENIEGIISGGILRLKIKEDIDPEYIALCINSSIGQMQVERDSGGSIIRHWKPEQVKQMLIPILSKPIQQKIADLVRQSHQARKKSKQLLEEAKDKVEEMIEKRV